MHPAARCRREGPPHETVLCRLEAGAGFSTRSAAADGRGTRAVIVPHEVIRTAGLAERIVRMSRSARPGILFADGNFHGDHRITDGILQADGAAVPCRVVGPKHSGRSTRHVSDCLEIHPQTPLPEGAATLALKWTDGSGEPQALRRAVTVRV